VFDFRLKLSHFHIHRKEWLMMKLRSFLGLIARSLEAQPPAACCVGAVHFANYR